MDDSAGEDRGYITTAEAIEHYITKSMQARTNISRIYDLGDHVIVELRASRHRDNLTRCANFFMWMPIMYRILPKKGIRKKTIIAISKKTVLPEAICIQYAFTKIIGLVCHGVPKVVDAITREYEPDILVYVGVSTAGIGVCGGKRVKTYPLENLFEGVKSRIHVCFLH